MDIQLKILLYWFAVTFILWVLTVLHFAFSNSNYNWKYFINEYSLAGIAYNFSLTIGGIIITVYLFVKASIWFFNL